jgi:hypothetical protein
MPREDTLTRFIQTVESGAHDRACEDFYTVDSTMQENGRPPRIGRAAHVANERRVLARARSVESVCVRPVFVCGDFVVIRWKFHFDWLNGTCTDIEELAYQRWEGERIAQETFFYDPAQLQEK